MCFQNDLDPMVSVPAQIKKIRKIKNRLTFSSQISLIFVKVIHFKMFALQKNRLRQNIVDAVLSKNIALYNWFLICIRLKIEYLSELSTKMFNNCLITRRNMVHNRI